MERRLACQGLICILASAAFGFGFSDKDAFAHGATKDKNQSLEENVQGNYASKVVESETHDVINPEYALGKPDQNYASIKPGGELTLKMEKPFSVMKFGGIGGRTGTDADGDLDYSVAVLVPTEERHGKIEYAWRWLPPSSVPGGLYSIAAGQVRVNELKIRNNTKDLNLNIDYVAGH